MKGSTCAVLALIGLAVVASVQGAGQIQDVQAGLEEIIVTTNVDADSDRDRDCAANGECWFSINVFDFYGPSFRIDTEVQQLESPIRFDDLTEGHQYEIMVCRITGSGGDPVGSMTDACAIYFCLLQEPLESPRNLCSDRPY